MVLVEVANAAGDDFESTLEFVAIEIDEVADVSKVVGGNGPKQVAIIIVLVVPVHSSAIEPGVVIDDFHSEVITLIDLMKEFSHGAGGISRILQPGIEDI